MSATTDRHGARHIDRNEGGAHTIAVSEGGKSGDVSTKHRRENLGLGLTQLRKFCGDVTNWALVLTQLDCLTARHVDDVRCEPFTRERVG
jgi:hypothetical protein